MSAGVSCLMMRSSRHCCGGRGAVSTFTREGASTRCSELLIIFVFHHNILYTSLHILTSHICALHHPCFRYIACTLFHCLSDPVLDLNHVASLVALAVQGCSDADDEAVRHNVSALCACCNSGGESGSSMSIASSVLASHAHPLLLRLQLLLSASSV
jgi:hypothetical protein